MAFLDDYLRSSPKKKPTKPRGTKTMGKVAPVNRPRNPYANPGRGKPVYGNADRHFTPQNDLYNQLATRNATPQKEAPKFGEYQQSFTSDPILQRIAALKNKTVEQARAEAAAARQQAIIDSGLGQLGTEFGVDPNTITAAQNNPFSGAADISNEFARRQKDLDEYLNQQGLFYSSARSGQLGDVATARARAEAELAAKVRALFGSINQGLTDTENAAEQQAISDSEGVEPIPGAPVYTEPPPEPSADPTADPGYVDYGDPLHELLAPPPAPTTAQQGYTYLPDGSIYDQYGNMIKGPDDLYTKLGKGAVL